jgi:hypothetical protein
MTAVTDAKVTYGVWGFVAGAGVAITIGFMWGGWTTSGTTQKMSAEAVLANRAAICVAQLMNSPNHKAVLKEFEATESYERAALIEKGGWDRMPGQEKADWGVSGACVEGVAARIRTGETGA